MWTDEEIKILIDMVLAGESSSSISRALNKTRNAIAGKARRLGLKLGGVARVHAPSVIRNINVTIFNEMSAQAKSHGIPIDRYIAHLACIGFGSATRLPKRDIIIL